MLYRSSTAFAVLALALSAWGLVGFFAWTITADESERVENAENAERRAIASASSVRTHALVQETAKEGTQLQDLLNVDVVSAAYMIEAVGKTAGVTVKLGDALPENGRASGEVAVKAVGFVVQANGKFPALMHAARLFETLPIPSSVTRLDIEHTPRSSPSAPSLWHMNVHIRVLTTSDISS